MALGNTSHEFGVETAVAQGLGYPNEPVDNSPQATGWLAGGQQLLDSSGGDVSAIKNIQK